MSLGCETQKAERMKKLNEILDDQYSEAKGSPGKNVIRILPRGLMVEMCCALDYVLLSIMRDRVCPSEQEWKTVYKYLPFQAAYEEPNAGRSEERRVGKEWR